MPRPVSFATNVNVPPQVCAIISTARSLHFVNPYAPMPKMWPGSFQDDEAGLPI